MSRSFLTCRRSEPASRLRKARVTNSTRRNRLTVESLERRELLAANLFADFSGPGGIADAEGFSSSGPADMWHLSTGRGADLGHSPNHSFYFGAGETETGGGLYTNFADGTLTSPPVDLTRAASAKLMFNTFLETERNFDFATVRVIDSLGVSTLIATSGVEMPVKTTGFEAIELDLTAFAGDTIQFEFQLTTDISVLREGWYIDDISVTSTDNRSWTPQGPFSASNGQVESLSPGGQIVGAIHTVLAHPTDADTLYIGATNGGVWRTDNASATFPDWTPLTDSLPSQSIGAMAFDTADPTSETLYAGTGRYSSFGRTGAERVGLYKSTDGGANWTILDDKLAGGNISGIAANADNVVVSVNVADSGGFANTGIFRSVDGGTTFTQVSVGDGTTTGLPGGFSYDLAVDPVNPNVLYTSTIFADGMGGQNGVYRSIDGGASWVKVGSPEMDALMISGETTNLEIAVGNANNVYAAIINFGDMKGLFRSGDGGQTWTQLDSPKTNEGGTDVGLNPRGSKGPVAADNPTPEELAGGQGSIHFSIVADPNDANIVYVGGDRQPRSDGDQGNFPNSIGARDFSGRLFRGDASLPAGSQFVHLTHSSTLGPAGGGTASGSSPHADSREMTFDAAGNLIETDDGGVYRRTSPQDNTGDWFGIIGNLQVTESHNVAYDNLSNVSMSGNQDTGSTYQPFEGAESWVSLTTADGGDIVIDNVSLAANNQSIRYSSFQNLGAFRKTTWDVSGNLVDQEFPALNGFDSPSFVTPVKLNAIDPNRLAIQGSEQTFETFDQAENVVGLDAAPGGGLFQNALAYGGRKDGVDNADVLWVGSDDDVYVRTVGTNALAPTAVDPTSDEVVALTIDPEDWASAFIVDADSVFTTDDVGASWTDITGDLMSLVNRLYSVTYVSSTVVDALLVGTNLGVFASLADSLGEWELVGLGMPNVITFDMDYDATDDVLVAGTLGRGTWTLDKVTELLSASEGVTTVTLDGEGNLLITDESGNYAEDVTIASDTVNQQFVITGVDQIVTSNIPTAVGSGTPVVTVPFGDVVGNEIIVNSLGGNDKFTIDFAAGQFDKAITYNGGDPSSGDVLRMVGGSFDDAVYDFVDSTSGTIGLTTVPTITYTETSAVQSTLSHAQVLLNFSDAAETLTPFGSSPGQVTVGSSAGASVSFAVPSDLLRIDSGDNAFDTVNFRGVIDLDGAQLDVAGDEVTLDGAQISTTGSAPITISAEQNFFANKDSRLQTVDGDITVIANRSATPIGGDFVGVRVDQSVLTTVTGDIRLEGRGGDEVDGSFNAGIRIDAGTQVTSTGTGASAGTITLLGLGGDAADQNSGVYIAGAATRIASVDGDIQITGIGGTGTADFNHGVVVVGGTIESTGTTLEAARISIDGESGVAIDNNDGVRLQGIDVTVTSVVGSISISGHSHASGAANAGVNFSQDAVVSSTGLGPAAASITVLGVGTAGVQANRGITFGGATTTLSTIDGHVTLTGEAGDSTGPFNEGITFFSGNARSTGRGDLTLRGTANGQGGEGVRMQGGAVIEATDIGNLRIEGVAALATDNDVLIGTGGATIGSGLGTGDLTILADQLDLDTATSIAGAGTLAFRPRSADVTIGLGGGAGTLSINDAELGALADGFTLVSIGDPTGGIGAIEIDTATFADPVTVVGGSIHIRTLDAAANDVTLRSRSGLITNSSAGPDVTGGVVTLAGQISPGTPNHVLDIDGALVIANDGSLTLDVGGLTPGDKATDHEQVRASAGVTIGARVPLAFVSDGGFVPVAGDSIVLVDNAMVGPVSGTFAGLAEGSLIPNFLGSGLSAIVSYVGGTDGNDIVATVLPGVTLSVDTTTIAEASGTATFTATLSGAVATPVVIDLQTSGTAQLASDYSISATQITIPAGELAGTVVVTAIEDAIVEANETLIVEITSIVGGAEVTEQKVVAIVADNDFRKPLIATTATNPTALSTLPMTVDFGGPVTGFVSSDLNVTGATLANFVGLGGGLYSFDLVPTSDGVVSVNIRGGAAFDTGNKVTLASAPFLVTVDRIAPTPVITGPGTRTNQNPIFATVDFGQAVTGFAIDDVSVSGGTVAGLLDNGNGSFQLLIDLAGEGPVSVDVAAGAAADLAGNSSEAALTYAFEYDATQPSPVIVGPVSPTNSNPIEVTLDFNETVIGFTPGDIAVVGGTVTELADLGGGVFSATIIADPTTLATGADVSVSVPADVAADETGNTNIASSLFVTTVDTIAPQPILSTAVARTNSDPFLVTIDFGEAVADFQAADVQVAG
ncbi:MAG: Ig-like domain-containing protein, partial [Rubripirellula sp.]